LAPSLENLIAALSAFITIGTNIFVLVSVIFKISKCKLLGLRSTTKPTGKSVVTAAEFVVRDVSVKLFLVTLV
jgi:hypothetical protein